MTAYSVIDPVATSLRPEIAEASKACGLFGSPAWLEVMREAYGYHPRYLVGAESGEEVSLLLPFMEVRSALTGRRGISVPFSDYCDIHATDERILREGMEFLIQWGRLSGWRYLELRPSAKLDIGPAHARYYAHSLDISRSEDECLRACSENTRRNIRKAQRDGLETRVGTSWEDMLEFYALHTLTRKHHGLPPQPLSFFRRLHERIVAKGDGMTVLARQNGAPAAGNVYLLAGDKAWYKYGALDRSRAGARAPFLAMWEAVRRLRERGVHSLCLGRSDLSGEGLVRYKDGWGAEKRIISYHRYVYDAGRFVEGPATEKGAHGVFRHMPTGMLRAIGSLLYRHVA